MENTVILRPGNPNDDCRTYLPEEILGSDMVINESGNNSIPWSPRLEEHHGVLVEGQGEDTWYVYVPESYDPSKKTPLVFGMHGGMMTGWGHSTYTSWVMVAEREGFICVFPNAHYKRMWVIKGMAFFDSLPEELMTHDTKMVLALIEHMMDRFNIDEGRIFMQGMSMGDLMTHQFVREHGHVLAGFAGSGGPNQPSWLFESDGSPKNTGGPLAAWRTHPELNGLAMNAECDEATTDRYNRFYWIRINECNPVPQIRIMGETNLAFYEGKKAPLTYLDVKNRDHGQTLDEAFLYWDYMFSGVHREQDGTLVHGETKLPRTGDEYAAAFTPGVAKVWWKNQVRQLSQAPIMWKKMKYHGLDGGSKIRGEYLCVPLVFLAEMAGAKYEPSEDTLCAVVTLKDGRRLQFARGIIGCMIDDTMRQMYCEALHRNGELLISAEWFCKYFLNLYVSSCNDVTYITDHAADLSSFMAVLIKDLLKGEEDPAKWVDNGLRLSE